VIAPTAVAIRQPNDTDSPSRASRMTGIKPRKPYRVAGAQFDSRSVRKWKPNPGTRRSAP